MCNDRPPQSSRNKSFRIRAWQIFESLACLVCRNVIFRANGTVIGNATYTNDPEDGLLLASFEVYVDTHSLSPGTYALSATYEGPDFPPAIYPASIPLTVLPPVCNPMLTGQQGSTWPPLSISSMRACLLRTNLAVLLCVSCFRGAMPYMCSKQLRMPQCAYHALLQVGTVCMYQRHPTSC